MGPLAHPVRQSGGLVGFGVDVIRSIPAAIRLYPAEVVRQSAVLIRGNMLVILFMIFMMGALVGITTTFLFEGIGLESYAGAIPAVPMMRGVLVIVFGWVLASKYGCGIVAELGAMRISEEIDAMDVMGVRSLPYLVGTKVVAAIIVIPAMFVIALQIFFMACGLFYVDLLEAVSAGGYTDVLFLLQGPAELAFATISGTVIGFVITVVATFYGYNASGGPVGVGRNTAQSMLVNLVLISLIALMLAQLFYANDYGAAFGT
ncbi:hypothetical protein ASE19_06780 [Nocardioides sp. Root79]|nr:hypothetical protein ASE19_06780 [Nocardioides sp. Root79]KRC71519.1 hypothetical protein ASE20_09195 [Nocardioides sp. Root240]